MGGFPDEIQADHSPVPYFLGGLAAMLGLIALALVILACANWKLSEEDSAGDGGGNNDLEMNHSTDEFEQKKIHVVIMAGEHTPTFLATSVAAKDGSGDVGALEDPDQTHFS